MAKYIKGKDGKFKGSIGDGKTRIPTAGQTPAGLKKSLDSVQNISYGRLPIAAPTIDLSYDPNTEANRVLYAMGKGGSFSERRERKKMRKELEAMFGPIDWKSTEPITYPSADFDTFWDDAHVSATPVQTPEPAAEAPTVRSRENGTDRDMLQAFSGRSGILWVRVADEGDNQFVRDGHVRMLFERIGSLSVAKDSEWYTKEHVLIQYGSHARRFDLDDISFTPDR